MYDYIIIMKKENKSINSHGRLEITDDGCLKIIDSGGIVLTVNKDEWESAVRAK